MFLGLLCLPGAVLYAGGQQQFGADAAGNAGPVGRFVSLPAPISESGIGLVSKALGSLQQRAVQENRSAVLVLQLPPGSSRFGAMRDLLQVLLSPQYAQVRITAWVPQSLTGSHLAVALGCHEIVAAGNVQLGDLRRGLTLDRSDEQFLLDLAARGRNPGLSVGVISSLLDAESGLQRAIVRSADGREQTRFLTTDELKALQSERAEIVQVEEVRAAGALPIYTAEQAHAAGFLVSRLAADRAEVAAQLRLPVEALREPSVIGQGEVRVLELRGWLSRSARDFATREIRRAKADRLSTLIVLLDTTGGDPSVCQEIAMLLAETDAEQLHTVAWIPRTATGAAALIPAGCVEIVAGPEAVWGGIPGLPANGNRGGQAPPNPAAADDSDAAMIQFLRSIGKLRKRSEGLLQTLAAGSQPVYDCSRVRDGRREWLTDRELVAQEEPWQRGAALPEQQQPGAVVFTGQRAFELGLALEPCADETVLRQRLGVPAEQALAPIRLTWVDRLVTMLNSSTGAFLLITIGLICLYVELHAPSAVFAIGTVCCFSLFFWSRFLGGTAGALELILFLLGFGLLALELLVIPGFGVCGITGILLLVISLIMASQTFSGLTAGQSLDRAPRFSRSASATRKTGSRQPG